MVDELTGNENEAARSGIRHVLRQAVADGKAPGIVTEVYDDNGRWFGQAGVADMESGRARRAEDRFRIASMTKNFTATVVLQLVAERQLDLEDTVEKWLPGLVQGGGHDGQKITVKRLLNQTSGVFNYIFDKRVIGTVMNPGFFKHRYDAYRPEDLIRIAVSNPAAFEPGERFQYTNTNYILAGMIVESVTGKALGDEISQRITRPLGLHDTYLPAEPTIDGRHARHYSTLYSDEKDAKIYDTTDVAPSMLWAGGGMISTSGDLTRFFRALLGGRLLPPALQAEMFTTVSTAGSGWISDTEYGLGLFSKELPSGVKVWGGGGAAIGSLTYTMGTRDGRHVVTSNVNGDWSGMAVLEAVLEAAFCPVRKG